MKRIIDTADSSLQHLCCYCIEPIRPSEPQFIRGTNDGVQLFIYAHIKCREANRGKGTYVR